MNVGTVCSGIGAPEVAWKGLGWRFAFASEIDGFPRAVFAHHHPEVPLHGDFTTIRAGAYRPIDLLAGGTPCQSFSVAGLRGGMDDARGNLALEFLRLADRLRPRWLVWENVPGVLSSNRGRDFGAFLGGLVELGYGFAYRVLDAQFFGVPQRRRRVFVVGYLGDWRRPAAVFFERQSLCGHPPPRREAGQIAAGTLAARAGGGGWPDGGDGRHDQLVAGTLTHSGKAAGSATQRDVESGMLVAFGGNNTSGPIDVATACNAHGGPHGRLDFETETFIAHTLRGEGFDASEDGSGRGTPLVPVAFTCKDHGGDAGDIAPTLRAMGHDGSHANAGGQLAVAFAMRGREGGAMPEISGEQVSALRAASGGSSRDYVAFAPQAGGKQTTLGFDPSLETVQTLAAKQTPAIAGGSAVRRLTPRECERLQGFPDDYTAIAYGKGVNPAKITEDWLKYMARGNPKGLTREDVAALAADGPRYKALGNSMAVPVMRWIGERIAAVDALQLEAAA